MGKSIGDDGARALGAALPHVPGLMFLSAGNCIGDDGARARRQVLDRGARALGPHRLAALPGDPPEIGAVVLGERHRRLRAQEVPRLVEEPVGVVGQARQHGHEQPGDVVVGAVALAGLAERVADLLDPVAAARHHGDEGMRPRDDLPDVAAVDRACGEAAVARQAVEELEQARHLGRGREHAREQRRAAASGADDESIHGASAVRGGVTCPWATEARPTRP